VALSRALLVKENKKGLHSYGREKKKGTLATSSAKKKKKKKKMDGRCVRKRRGVEKNRGVGTKGGTGKEKKGGGGRVGTIQWTASGNWTLREEKRGKTRLARGRGEIAVEPHGHRGKRVLKKHPEERGLGFEAAPGGKRTSG